MSTDLVARAKAGDQEAFRELVGPYRAELHVHCYRILGSVQDAEDALQETLLSAWRGLGGFERRASVRTWLYSVATSRALNMLRAERRRPQVQMPPDVSLPEPTRRADPLWLEPYPDVLIENELASLPGPEARYETKEAISLAFVTALQLLPARQRAGRRCRRRRSLRRPPRAPPPVRAQRVSRAAVAPQPAAGSPASRGRA